MRNFATDIRTLIGAGLLLLAITAACTTSAGGDQKTEDAAVQPPDVSQHLVAHATLTAHLVGAMLKAGHSTADINDALARIADQTVIDEFWVSNDRGEIDYTSHPHVDFAFPASPAKGTQAAPFAQLLSGERTVVVQRAQPREHDGELFQYAGVAGVDAVRIVQVGIRSQRQ